MFRQASPISHEASHAKSGGHGLPGSPGRGATLRVNTANDYVIWFDIVRGPDQQKPLSPSLHVNYK